MISITPVPIESDMCTTTNTSEHLDVQLGSALIRQTLCQHSQDILYIQPLLDTDSDDRLSYITK